MKDDKDKFKDIVDFADKLRRELEITYVNRPVEEFLAWLRIGLEREAMVSKAYSREFITPQVEKLKMNRNLEKLVIESILSAWSQETAHEQFAASAIDTIDPPKNIFQAMDIVFKAKMGQVQASVINGLISGKKINHLAAKLAIVFGRSVIEVPKFIDELKESTFRDFCLLNMALEATAISGYRRINELLIEIAMYASHPYSHTTFIQDFHKIYNEEKYHYELFKYFSTFPPSDDQSKDPEPVPPNDGSIDKSLEKEYVESLSLRIKRDIIDLKNQTLGRYASKELRKLVVDVDKLKQDSFIIYMYRYFQNFSLRPSSFSPEAFNAAWVKEIENSYPELRDRKIVAKTRSEIQRDLLSR